jgi:DNA-binding response OmpR family regulator
MHPGPSGFEICKQIKSTKEFKQIPIFFVSARYLGEPIRCAKEIGADGYIFKPFAFSDFDIILNLLGTRQVQVRLKEDENFEEKGRKNK